MTGPDDCPPYPDTQDEHAESFIAKARGIEEQLFGLSQEIYNEVMAVRNTNPPTFTQVATDIKRVLEDGMAKINADVLTEPAIAADKAWGYLETGPVEETDLPHT